LAETSKGKGYGNVNEQKHGEAHDLQRTC
jgi:hypothetical protein